MTLPLCFKLLISNIEAILFPFGRITFYMIPYFFIASLISYNMIMKGTLPNLKIWYFLSDFFGNCHLVLSNDYR